MHNFALDAVDRCTAEINQARELYAEDANKIKSMLSYTKHVMVMGFIDYAKKNLSNLQREGKLQW